MVVNDKNKINKKNKHSLLIALCLLLVLSVGFAFLTSNLNMLGNTFLKSQTWDVHFQNVQLSDDGVQIEKPTITDDGTTVEYNVTLDKPGDFVEFTVDAKNDGTIDAMVDTVSAIRLYDEETKELLESIPDYLEYSVTYLGYEDVPIAKYHLLESGQSITYKVHVGYKKDITKEQLVTSRKEFKAEFNVTFAQADDNATAVFSNNDHQQTTLSTLSKDKLHSFGEKYNPKKVMFLDIGVSDSDDEKYVDISEEQDKSILAWMDGETMYVSAEKSGLYVKAPEDCSLLLGDSTSFRYDSWIKNLEKIDASKLDTSSVINMNSMFRSAGYNAETFELCLNNWDTSNVTNMYFMFYSVGYKATEWRIGDISGWDVSSVIDMNSMFYSAGYNTETFELDLRGWKIGEAKMYCMFMYAGAKASSFELDINDWDTSQVTDMSYMLSGTGRSASYSLDLSSWNVSNVTSYKYFNTNVEDKVTPPTWIN